MANATGLLVPEDSVRASMRELARLVAVALDDSATRAVFESGWRSSTYREQKQHFASLLGDRGRPILARMAARAGRTQTQLLQLVSQVVDLEIYLPVREHRRDWAGGRDAVVAFALHDHEIPEGFRIGGEPFVFTSAEVPPPTPVIALVPVETDFRISVARAMCYEDCGSGGGGSGGSPPPPPAGLYMTFAAVTGDFEGFLMGDPEFEIHVMSRKTALDTGAVDNQCIGEHAANSGNQSGIKSTLYVYDQNNAEWSGSVMLFDQDRIDAARVLDSSLAIWMWEDDNDDCKIVQTDHTIESVIKDLVPILIGGNNALKVLEHQTLGNILAAGIVLYKALNTFSNWQNDDHVGVIVAASSVGASYGDATHAIVNRDGSVRGRAWLEMRQ